MREAVKDCDKFKPIKMADVENSVFDMLWQFTFDRPHFKEAIKDLKFDVKQREKLETEKSTYDSELAEIERKLYNISEAIADGIKIEAVKRLQYDLYSRQNQVQKSLDSVNDKHSAFEESDVLQNKVDQTRKELQAHFKSTDLIKEMSFDEKRTLLNYFFNGTDQNGKSYGIYIDKNSAGMPQVSLYGYIPIDLGSDHALIKKVFKTKKDISSKNTGEISFKREKTFLPEVDRLTKLF